QGASLRVEFRREVLLTRVTATTAPPADAASFARVAPLPDLRKMPGRFYPINYLFIEITNACNFQCTWWPTTIREPRPGSAGKGRGVQEEGEGVPDPRRDRGQARLAGPALPRQAAPDGRAVPASRPARDRGVRGEPRRGDRAQHELRAHHEGQHRGALPRRP